LKSSRPDALTRFGIALEDRRNVNPRDKGCRSQTWVFLLRLRMRLAGLDTPASLASDPRSRVPTEPERQGTPQQPFALRDSSHRGLSSVAIRPARDSLSLRAVLFCLRSSGLEQRPSGRSTSLRSYSHAAITRCDLKRHHEVPLAGRSAHSAPVDLEAARSADDAEPCGRERSKGDLASPAKTLAATARRFARVGTHRVFASIAPRVS